MKALRIAEGSLAVLGEGLLVAIMLLVTADVVARGLFKAPILGTLELTEFFVAVAVFAGLAYVESKGKNLNVDLVMSHLGARGRVVCLIIGDLLGLVFFALLAWQGAKLTLNVWRFHEIISSLPQVPSYPFKVFVLLGSFILCLRYLADMIMHVMHR